MKPVELIVESIERYVVKLSFDQAYRAIRRIMELIEGASREHFTLLRIYAQEFLNSNPNNNVVKQCSESTNGTMFERIYVCLQACKVVFAKICRPLIGLGAYFLKRDYGYKTKDKTNTKTKTTTIIKISNSS